MSTEKNDLMALLSQANKEKPKVETKIISEIADIINHKSMEVIKSIDINKLREITQGKNSEARLRDILRPASNFLDELTLIVMSDIIENAKDIKDSDKKAKRWLKIAQNLAKKGDYQSVYAIGNAFKHSSIKNNVKTEDRLNQTDKNILSEINSIIDAHDLSKGYPDNENFSKLYSEDKLKVTFVVRPLTNLIVKFSGLDSNNPNQLKAYNTFHNKIDKAINCLVKTNENIKFNEALANKFPKQKDRVTEEEKQKIRESLDFQPPKEPMYPKDLTEANINAYKKELDKYNIEKDFYPIKLNNKFAELESGKKAGIMSSMLDKAKDKFSKTNLAETNRSSSATSKLRTTTQSFINTVKRPFSERKEPEKAEDRLDKSNSEKLTEAKPNVVEPSINIEDKVLNKVEEVNTKVESLSGKVDELLEKMENFVPSSKLIKQQKEICIEQLNRIQNTELKKLLIENVKKAQGDLPSLDATKKFVEDVNKKLMPAGGLTALAYYNITASSPSLPGKRQADNNSDKSLAVFNLSRDKFPKEGFKSPQALAQEKTNDQKVQKATTRKFPSKPPPPAPNIEKPPTIGKH